LKYELEMSDYEINVIFSICLSVTLLALGAEFYRLVNSIVKGKKEKLFVESFKSKNFEKAFENPEFATF
jgi:hypothetical protein